MKIAIRADASAILGSGHIMRMLALAGELRRLGHTIRFLARQIPEALRDQVQAQGHDLTVMDCSFGWRAPVDAEWSDEEQMADALATAALLDGESWIICDHYGLGVTWEAHLSAMGRSILAVDDLGRPHRTAMLLDQNYYADPEGRYSGYEGQALLGPRYALLRPEFALERRGLRRDPARLERLLISMGGTDAADVTSFAADAIELADLSHLAVDIVIGSGQPARETLAARCEAQPGWRLHVQTNSMASLLAAADLVIGAGGTTTWERCALAIPTLALQLADNQREILRQGARAGFLYVPDSADTVEQLALHLRAIANNCGLRAHMSMVAASITDGAGAVRVAKRLDS